MRYVYELRDQDTLITEGFVSTKQKLSSEQQRILRTLLAREKSQCGSSIQAIKRTIVLFNKSCPLANMQIHDNNIQQVIEF